MRPVGADDVRRAELRQSVRGYAIEDVDELLERVAVQLERREAEVTELRGRLRDAEARLGAALESGAAVQRRLATAEHAADTALADARQRAQEVEEAVEREANRRLERAEADATEVRHAARREAEAERARSARLRQLRASQRDEYRRHLQQCLAELEDQVAEEGVPGADPADDPDAAPAGGSDGSGGDAVDGPTR